MSIPKAPALPPTVQDVPNDSDRAPLSETDNLQAVLDAEIATHASILTTIERCKLQLYELSHSTSPRHPAICDLRDRLDHALQEASRLKTRQDTLRMQLLIASSYHWRLEGNASGLGFAVGGFWEARDESLRMEFAASAQVFDSFAYGARMVVG